MELKSTLRVFNETTVKANRGVVEGQVLKMLVGNPEQPTERIHVALASYKAGTVEPLHWHPIEAFYYIISGRAIVRDIEDKEYDVGAGTVIYASPGLQGSHEWEAKEALQLIAIRATTDLERKLQFTVDKATKRSYIEVDELARRGGLRFKSLY
jgi:mannose-6-phosphate isomerase-like protein (cupin superfamily)